MESELHVYELDGIQRIEAKLSEGLTADPEQSKASRAATLSTTA